MNMRNFHNDCIGLVLLLSAIGAVSAQQPDSGNDTSAEIAALEPAVSFSADTAGPPPSEPTAPESEAPPVRQGTPGVADRLDLGTTSITGNQELPKVLYIVPWKRSDLGNLVGRPVNTLLDEVLAPVDPQVFERHLDYYDTLYGAREQE